MTAWDRKPVSQMRAEQDKAMRTFISEQIYPFSPHYHSMLKELKLGRDSIRSVKDLRKLPFTMKADIAPSKDDPGRFRKFVLQPNEASVKKYMSRSTLIKWKLSEMMGGTPIKTRLTREYKPVHLHFTTGRSAIPTPFTYSTRDVDRLKEAGSRLFNVFEVKEDWVCVNAFPYSPHLAFWLAFYGVNHMYMTSLHTGGGKVLGSEKIVMALESMKANAMTSLPGYGYHLMKMAAEQNRNLSNLETVIFGGERLPQGLKIKIRELLSGMGSKNPKIVATYASTELRVAYGECPCSGNESMGYHTYPDWEVIEIIDPKTGENVGDGEAGEIVYSALDWRGTCVLRYRTGDMAKKGLTWEKCPNCGRTVPRLSADITRVSEVKEFNLSKVKGTLVDLNAFFPLLTGHEGVDEWQLEIYKPRDDPFETDHMTLYMSVRPGHDFAKVSNEVLRQILHETEIRPNDIVQCTAKEMEDRLCVRTELKEKRIVDRRPK